MLNPPVLLPGPLKFLYVSNIANNMDANNMDPDLNVCFLDKLYLNICSRRHFQDNYNGGIMVNGLAKVTKSGQLSSSTTRNHLV